MTLVRWHGAWGRGDHGRGLRGPSCHGLLNSSSRKGGNLCYQGMEELFGGHGGAHRGVISGRRGTGQGLDLCLKLLDL